MDRAAAGGLAGIVSGIIVGFISFALHLLGICRICLISIGGGMFRQEMLGVTAPMSWLLLGWVTHLIISSLLGIMLVYILVFTGREHALWKGLLFGSAVWAVDIMFVSPLAGFVPLNANPIDLFIVLGYHMLFGILVAWFLVRHYESALQRS